MPFPARVRARLLRGRIPARGRSPRSLIALTLLGAKLGSQQIARPALLSADARAHAVVRRCLANAFGTVARFTDTEAYAAVDPRNANRVVAVWQTGSGSGSAIQWARSSDGGATWTAPHAAPINSCAGGPVAGATRASDPWVTFGPDGRLYVSAIAFTPNPGDGADLVSALVVVASPDGGATWERPVAAAVAPSPVISHDNLAITADPTQPGTLYAATTRAESPDAATYYGRLGFTRSTDGGKSWTPIRAITAAVNRERIGAPQIVVDPRSGRLYAVYHRRTAGVSSIGVMSSGDRGDTWSRESVGASHIDGERPRDPNTGERFILADDIVQGVVSPTTGQLVIAYSDARRAPGIRHDVSVIWSADGVGWSPPRTISDSSAQSAWLPAVAITKTGEIGVSYFSAEFTSTKAATARVRLLLHRFRLSATGLEPIDRVVLDTLRLVWPGDYQGLVAAGARFAAVYGREGDIAAVTMK